MSDKTWLGSQRLPEPGVGQSDLLCRRDGTQYRPWKTRWRRHGLLFGLLPSTIEIRSWRFVAAWEESPSRVTFMSRAT